MDEKLARAIENIPEQVELNGYAVIENFLTEDEVRDIREESRRLIEDESVKDEDIHIFGNENNSKSEYFMTSGDKIRYFFEDEAFKPGTRELKVHRHESLSKIGHALHCFNPVFKRVTTSDKVKQVFRAVGFQDPRVVQSMIIFKNPKVGGAYTPHQDAQFLCSDPADKLAGIWFALDDATETNGCLEFIPGSHKWPLVRRKVRIPDKGDGKFLEWTAPIDEYEDSQFVKLPVKRGAMIFIHGLAMHRSDSNKSDKPRWIYTFHAYDKSAAKYCDDNWLQVPNDHTFMPINVTT